MTGAHGTLSEPLTAFTGPSGPEDGLGPPEVGWRVHVQKGVEARVEFLQEERGDVPDPPQGPEEGPQVVRASRPEQFLASPQGPADLVDGLERFYEAVGLSQDGNVHVAHHIKQKL